MDDEYELVKQKPLRLPSDKDKGHRKRRRKESGSTTESRHSAPSGSKEDPSKIIVVSSTKAEQAFKSKQDEIARSRILKKASKTHKQRVEEFNKHLDSLSEHYDIPKVSWTK